MRRRVPIYVIVALGVGATALYSYGRSLWVPVYQKAVGKRTVAEVVELYGQAAVARLKPKFDRAGITYPPQALVLLATKAEKKLEVWAKDSASFTYIHTYDIQKTSGKAGPKLQEGDGQVPEGIYRIIGLNPNSAYHLSLKLNYPNATDLRHAQQEGRSQPGSNIFIHGKAVSIGCLAMGDPVIEELFVLTENVGMQNVSVIIAPSDPREQPLRANTQHLPAWTQDLYADIEAEFLKYQRQKT